MPEENTDPIEEVKAAGKERFLSPFYLSLFISFVVWNWRAIYFLLFPDGDYSIEQRLSYVDATLYPSFWWDHAIKLIIAPVLSAGFAVSVIPWLALWLDGPRYRASVELYNRHRKIDLRRKEQQEEIETLKQTIAQRDSEIKDKAQELRKLREKENVQSNRHVQQRQELLRGLIPVLSELKIAPSVLAEIETNGGIDIPSSEILQLRRLVLIEPEGIKRNKLTETGKELRRLWQ